MDAPPANCVICGGQPVEAHHAAGRAHDSRFVVGLCWAHHRLVHDDLADAGCDLRHRPVRTPLESTAEGLRCTAVFLARIAEALDLAWLGAFSDYLIGRADTLTDQVHLLDRHVPGWRTATTKEPQP